jgi:hypothetical protein
MKVKPRSAARPNDCSDEAIATLVSELRTSTNGCLAPLGTPDANAANLRNALER